MEGKRENSFSKLEWMINALLVAAALLSLVNVVWGLDTQDTVVEWTDAGKRLATECAARWKVKDEMVLAPAGDFLMGSDLKFVLATNRLPQLDWRYNGGNFQGTSSCHACRLVAGRNRYRRLPRELFQRAVAYIRTADQRLNTAPHSAAQAMQKTRLELRSMAY